MQFEIPLDDRHSDEIVIATLIERVDVGYARSADRIWGEFVASEEANARSAGRQVSLKEHWHWRWGDKVEAVGHLLSYPTLAVEYEGVPQGLMLLKTDGEFGRLDDHAYQPLVYVAYLAAAPWNIAAFVGRPRFQGIGTVLMRAAVQTSLELGFQGRLGLHSLPRADGFYRHHGMTCLGKDADKQDLNYFEMTAAQANAFIE